MLSIAWTKARPYQVAWRDAAIAWGAQHVAIVGLAWIWQTLLPFGEKGAQPFVAFDGLWYLHIARDGYVRLPDAAFFPLYPALVRIVALGGQYVLGALIVANLCGLLAFALLRILIEEEADRATARRALVYFACFPTAIYLVAGYTESLFLTLTLLAFLALRRRQWRIVALATLGATLTRSTGILLLLPITIEGWRALRWRVALVGLPALLGLAAWEVAVSVRFHVVGGIAAAMNTAMWMRHLDWPWFGIVRGFQSFGHTIPAVAVGTARDLLFTGLWIACCLALTRRLPPAYAAFAWGCLALVLCMPLHARTGQELVSLPRYMLICFPVYWLLARWGRNKWAHLAIFAALLLAQVVLLMQFSVGAFVS
jgi:Gpi18-like mannosyltransferase